MKILIKHKKTAQEIRALKSWQDSVNSTGYLQLTRPDCFIAWFHPHPYSEVKHLFQLSSRVTAKCLEFGGSLQCMKKKTDHFPNRRCYQYKRLIYKNGNTYNLIQLYFHFCTTG